MREHLEPDETGKTTEKDTGGDEHRAATGSRVRGFAGSRVRGFAGSRVRRFDGSRVQRFNGSARRTLLRRVGCIVSELQHAGLHPIDRSQRQPLERCPEQQQVIALPHRVVGRAREVDEYLV